MPVEATRDSHPAADPALLVTWLILGSLTLPGRPEHVSAARRFVAREIGDDHPRADAALLLTSELATNAVVHSRSRLPGGTVTVAVARNASSVLVTVTDDGAEAGHPVLAPCQEGEHGNGLLLVESMAECWGYQQEAGHTVVWFTLGPDGSPAHPDAHGLLPAHEREAPQNGAHPGTPGGGWTGPPVLWFARNMAGDLRCVA